MDILDKEGLQVFKYWEDRPMPVATGDPDLPAIVYSVPGKEAVAVVVSYAREDKELKAAFDLKALGMSGAVTVVDAESGAELKTDNGKISIPIKKHDIKVLRIGTAK